jgi:dipeptidyl aminopeptidase/acylaminoacyl peptidase
VYNRDQKVWVRPVAGGPLKKLGGDHDGPVSVGFWSEDGSTIYSNAGIGATRAVVSIDVDSGRVTQVTDEKASLSVSYDRLSDALLINYSDPVTPSSIYTVQSMDQLGNRANWMRLANSNPQVDEIALGETEAIEWRSTDGKMVEGVLVKPLDYEPGKRYPLVVQIHGGPASATVLSFNGGSGYYSHIYAAAGYVALLPNYRGSSNYGEEFRTEIIGDYFRQGYEDIMAGVDHLIETGLVDGDRMGVMGWSAGGHWSNWILTHTDRFKAISSGAGTMNWISMYAQSDVQRNRQNYFGTFPYDDFEALWDISPLKYIKNAKTPTMIHVVHGDPRVPRPQSEELHMALKKLGVPTEFFVYPGDSHGIPGSRNRLVKMVSEFNWMERYINGKDGWFEWEDLLKTLPTEEEEDETTSRDQPQRF